jgi:hypothetical protein
VEAASKPLHPAGMIVAKPRPTRAFDRILSGSPRPSRRGRSTGDEGTRAPALCLGLGIAGHGARCGAQPLDELHRQTPARVRVPSQAGCHVRLAEGGSGGGRRVPVEEVKSDRPSDVCEDGAGAQPDLLEQEAQLIRKRNALGV